MGKGEKMGWGRQRYAIILLTVIKKRNGQVKKKIYKLRKTDPFSVTETPSNKRVDYFTLAI